MATQESRLIISIDARNAEQRAKDLARELQNITTAGGNADRQVNQMSSSLRSLAGYMAGLVTVGTAISKMDTYTGLQNRLKLVTKNQEQLTQAMNDTYKIAQETAQAWESVAQVYQRFADNAKTLNITMEQTASLTNTVAKAIAVSGGSAASSEAALVQFGQALASGVLRGEEFNSIAEQAPALLKAIAGGLEVNIGQLRAMAADGKLTGDVVVKSLEKSKESVDELFAKTDFTIANSFTQLNNAVIQFVGEAGKANGAASFLSSSIKTLADNLDSIANVAVLGGVALLTKAILTQVAATKTAITTAVARRASLLGELQATTVVTSAEVRRTEAVAAFTAMQLADARATAARLTGMQRLAYVQSTVLPLERANTAAVAAHTAAVSADTVAQNANAAARSRSAMLLGAVGGPIGALTIGVTALAAGYMYMSSRTEEANKKLEEQMQWASKTKEELLKLDGVQREVAKNELSKAFEEQNKRLRMLDNEFLGFIDNVARANSENKKAAEVFELARQGTISQADALERLNKLDVLTPEQKKQGLDMVNSYILQAEKALKAGDALTVMGKEADVAGNKASNSATKQQMLAGSMDNVASSTNSATSALQKYNQTLKDRAYDAEYMRVLREKHGYTKAEAEETLKAQRAAGGAGKRIDKETTALIKNTMAQEKRLEAIDEAEKKREQSERKAVSAANAAQRKQEAAQRKAEAAQQKALDEANRLAEKQADLRIKIATENLNDLEKIEEDYLQSLQDIKDADFGKDTQKFTKLADQRYKYNLKMYELQIEQETASYMWSEKEKLAHWYKRQKAEITLSGKYSAEVQKIKLNALEKEHQLESAYIDIANREREFQSSQQFMNETQRINEKYEIEKQNILKINDEQVRASELRLSALRKEAEINERVRNAQVAWVKTQAQLLGTSTDSDFAKIDQDAFEQTQQSDAFYEAEMALANSAERREEIWKAHQERMTMIQRSADMARLQLGAGYASSMVGSMATMMKGMTDECSTGYRALFAISKGFAIAQAAIALAENVANASKIGFPYNIPMIAGALAQGATITSLLTSATAPTGFKTGGYTGNMGVNDVAGVVHGREFVMTAEATKRIGVGTLNAVNNGADLQAQRNASAMSGNQPSVNLNPNFVIVDERENVNDYLYSPDGQKAFVKVFKRNRSQLGV